MRRNIFSTLSFMLLAALILSISGLFTGISKAVKAAETVCEAYIHYVATDGNEYNGAADIYTNTVKEDNYKYLGLLDKNTNNPAVLCFAYLMTNTNFKKDYCDRLLALSDRGFSKDNLNSILDGYIGAFAPLYGQFFDRYPGSGTAQDALYGDYASAKCIRDFIAKRGTAIQSIVDWINRQSI